MWLNGVRNAAPWKNSRSAEGDRASVNGTWFNSQPGVIHFDLTQLMSGHGCFRAYLLKFKIEPIFMDPLRTHFVVCGSGTETLNTCSLCVRNTNTNDRENLLTNMLRDLKIWKAL